MLCIIPRLDNFPEGVNIYPCSAFSYAWGETVQRPPQHGATFNVLHCDQHVAAIRISDLWNATNTARSWNNEHQPHLSLPTTESDPPLP